MNCQEINSNTINIFDLTSINCPVLGRQGSPSDRVPSFLPLFNYLFLLMEDKRERLTLNIKSEDQQSDNKPIIVNNASLQYVLQNGAINLIPLGLIDKIEKIKVSDNLYKINIALKRDIALNIVVPKETIREIFGKRALLDVRLTVNMKKNISWQYEKRMTNPYVCWDGENGPHKISDPVQPAYLLSKFKAEVSVLADSLLINIFDFDLLGKTNKLIKQNISNLIAIVAEADLFFYERWHVELGQEPPLDKKPLMFWSAVIEGSKLTNEFYWNLSKNIEQLIPTSSLNISDSLSGNIAQLEEIPDINLSIARERGFGPIFKLQSDLGNELEGRIDPCLNLP